MTALFANIKHRRTDTRVTEVFDQLDRASLYALLNTAEGNGPRHRRTRAKLCDDARGSASEYAAFLDALVAKGICTKDEIDEGKRLFPRIVSILTKLVERFDASSSASSFSIIRKGPDGGSVRARVGGRGRK